MRLPWYPQGGRGYPHEVSSRTSNIAPSIWARINLNRTSAWFQTKELGLRNRCDHVTRRAEAPGQLIINDTSAPLFEPWLRFDAETSFDGILLPFSMARTYEFGYLEFLNQCYTHRCPSTESKLALITAWNSGVALSSDEEEPTTDEPSNQVDGTAAANEQPDYLLAAAPSYQADGTCHNSPKSPGLPSLSSFRSSKTTSESSFWSDQTLPSFSNTDNQNFSLSPADVFRPERHYHE